VGAGADPLAVHGLDIAVRFAESGRLRIPVAATFPLTGAAAAHELSETRHAPEGSFWSTDVVILPRIAGRTRSLRQFARGRFPPE
jgi:hypothetical protein